MKYSRITKGSIAALAIAGLTLAGCGSSKSSSASSVPTSSSSTSPNVRTKINLVGLSADATDPYFITIECGAQAEAKALGVKFKWGGTASESVSAEESALSSLTATSPSGVLLAPWSSSAFVTPVGDLMKKGIPVVTVDSPLTKDVQYQAFYTNNLTAGETLAGPLAKAIGDKGEVAILTYGAGDEVQNDRWKGLEEALKKYPNIKFLPVEYIGISSTKAAQTTTSIVVAHPELKAIFTTSGPLGDGAASALKALHKTGVIKLYSFDAEPVEIAMIKDGELQGTVAQSPYLEGKDAVKSLVTLLQRLGGSANGHVIAKASPFVVHTPVRLITRANVNSASSKALYLYGKSCS